MFTLILLSERAKSILQRSRVFFEPFEEEGRIAFCEWNQSPDACTLAEALPDLPRLIRGKRQWRAVVVDHVADDEESTASRKADNPFDFLDNDRVGLALEDSPHPLVRIAHILLGYPELSAKGFDPVVSYEDDEQPGRRRSLSRRELCGEEGAASDSAEASRAFYQKVNEAVAQHNDVRVEYREQEYSPEQKSLHADLAERYRMKETQPDEVIFISTRSPVAEDSKAELERAWLVETERTASRFIERNDYPPATRFAVYDLVSPQNSRYEHDELKLWLCVLTVAVNLLPSGSFQAERVYRLGIGLSDDSLGDLLNTHMSRLATARDRLETRIHAKSAAPVTSVRELTDTQEIPVQFERLGGEAMAVETAGYGLASDAPRLEIERWEESFAQLRGNAERFIRAPRRVLAHAVEQTRDTARSYLGTGVSLDSLEREELAENLRARIGPLTAPATTHILDRRRLDALLAAHRARIAAHIRSRMRLRAIWTATAVVAAVWVAAFVPYLLQAARAGGAQLGVGALVVVLVLWALGVAGLIALFLSRLRLLALLRSLNSAMRSFASGVYAGAGAFAGYLSNLATYMHAHSALIGSSRAEDARRAKAREYALLRDRIAARLGEEKAIVAALGVQARIQLVPGGMRDFDPDNPHAVDRLFRYPVDGGVAEFNESGEQIDAPYGFVRCLSVERVAVFEAGAPGEGA